MSSNLTEQQKKNRKAFSKTIKNQIKRRPHTEPINGIQYTYGLLEKKSQSAVFNNQRLLIIKGHQTFGYASKLPDDTLLPFLDQDKIPKCKVNVDLDKLEIDNLKEILIVSFKQENKKETTKWEFKCESKVKAIEWRQKLQGARNQRIANIQNNAVKVILEDPNQNIEDSEMEQKRRNIEIINFKTLSQQPQLRVQPQGKQNIFTHFEQQAKHHNNSAIMVQDQQQSVHNSSRFPEHKSKNQHQTQNINPSQAKQTNQQNPKLPQYNIFQSLLSSSPSKQPLQSSKVNQSTLQKQKLSSPSQSKQKNPSLSLSQQQQQQNHNYKGNKAKEQFQKRKKQQTEIKEQLLEENNSMFKNLIKTVADSKYQIQKMKKQWGYEFAKSLNEQDIVEHFKIYVETIAVKIVDELALEARKRYYKPNLQNSESIKYEIEGVSLEFFLNQLTQVSSFQGKGSIISNLRVKQAYQQMKNYDYILQLTNNKGRIRVPLATIVQYKGFVCLAKIIIPQSQNYEQIQSLQKQLDLLQAQSRINNSVFQDNQNGRIIPLQSKIYQKIARAQNNYASNIKKFDICYVEGLKNYLPQDFYSYHQKNSNNANKNLNNRSNNVLRRQLVQDQEYEDVLFYGEDMVNVISRLKIPQHLKEGVDVLVQVSKTISDRVSALVVALQNLDEFVTNSKDLSNLMHGYGINVRYLGLVLERSKQGWLKGIIISQIAARCAKYFLKFDLQDCILNLNETKIQKIRRYQIKQVISFLNKVLGNSEQTDLFWNQLSRQSQQYFQCYLDRNLINVGFFLQSLQTQCRIKLKDIFQHQDKFFKVAEPLNTDNFSSFSIKSKTYDLSFTDLYTNVSRYLKDVSQQSFEQLSILLNLSRKGSLPSHFNLNGFDQKILLYMINWLSPSEGKQIYYPAQIQFGDSLPTKTLYQIKLTQIKWLLKDKRQEQAQLVRDFLINHINKWLGQYHPILSQLYDLFSRYHSTSKLEQKKSITYCKSSIKNIEKLLSSLHIKLADNYYMLAEIYINYQKKTEALSSLKRAKEILEEREGQETEAYGVIGLRMGQLFLASNLVKEALEQGVKSYMRIIQSDDLGKFVQCIELIGRCYEVVDMWAEYTKFTKEIINNSNKLQLLAQDPLLLQRTVKVLILPHFTQLSKNPQVSRQILSILLSFTSLTNLTPSLQNSSYSYIKSLLLSPQKIFPNEFITIVNSELQELLEEIESSGIMTRWKGFENLIMNKSLLTKINTMSGMNVRGFEFLAMLQALAVLVGQGWIQGVLTDA